MSDIGAGFDLALKFMAVAAAAVVIGVGGAVYVGVDRYQENKTVTALKARAEDTLRQKNSLTVITMDKFKKNGTCDAEHPYGADFTAQGPDSKVVRGHVCSSPDRESIVTLKP
ncbi:MAG: hypothetical protein ACAH83_09670 [Alphaproteobacteria bacterium]